MRYTVCEMDQCTGCKVRMDFCPKDALKEELSKADTETGYNRICVQECH